MVVNWKPAIACSAVVMFLLAGCTTNTPGGPVSTTSLTRHITVTIDPLSATPPLGNPDQVIAKYATVWFEYTHAGAPLDVAGVTVRYQNADGLESSSPLSAFTSKAQLLDGETLKIAPAGIAVTSALSLESGRHAFATRLGTHRDWLEVAGVPTPIASSKPGKATWTMHASAGAELHLHGLAFSTPAPCSGYVCEGAPVANRIDSLDATLLDTIDGNVALETTVASGPTITFQVPSLTNTASADLSMTGQAGNESLAITAHAGMKASLSGKADLGFDGSRQLSSLAAEGNVALDASVTGTGPGTDEFPPPFHFAQNLPHTSIPMPPLGHQADPTIVAFLERVWSLDLIVGDEFGFSMKSPVATAEYVSQVVGKEPRTVGGTPRETLRIVDHFSATALAAPPSLRDITFDLTYWIDAESYLPVYEQGTISQTLHATDYPELRQLLETAMASDHTTLNQFPSDAALTLTGTVDMEMTSYTGDFAAAGVLASGGSRMMPVAVVGAAVVFVLVNNLGKGTAPAAHAPNIAFAANDDQDTITIVAAGAGADWNNISVAANSCTGGTVNVGGTYAPHVNVKATAASHQPIGLAGCAHPMYASMANDRTPVTAGDYLSFCTTDGATSNVQLTVTDMASNTQLGSFYLPTVAPCA